MAASSHASLNVIYLGGEYLHSPCPDKTKESIMQQKISPAIIAAAAVFALIVVGMIGYFATRPSQDTVSKENAPSYAKEQMNKSNGGAPSNYGHAYSEGPHS